MRVDIHSHALINLTLWNKNLATKKHKAPKFWNPLRNQIDIPRLVETNLQGISFTIYPLPRFLPRLPSYFKQVQLQIQKFHQLLQRSGYAYEAALNGEHLAQLIQQGKRAAFLSMEGSHGLERMLPRLEYLKKQGLFYITLTHFVPNGIAAPCHTSWFFKEGITPLGRLMLKSMEKLHILPDTAHLSEKSYQDFIKYYHGPILCTHTGSRQLKNIERNIPEWVLEEAKHREALIGVIAFPLYLTGRLRESTRAMAETAARFAEKIGPHKIAIGTDFDGYIFGPTDMRDITGWTHLERSLKEIGFSTTEIQDIAGQNAVRFFKKHVKSLSK